jgi:N-acetylmuramoyl-L-alanine amidase
MDKGGKGMDVFQKLLQKKKAIWLSGMVLASALMMVIASWIFWPGAQWTFHMPLAGRVIVLDPGHGGADGGAISKGGLVEKDVALQVALYLRDYLQEAGALVVMTRETDKDLADEGSRRRKAQDLMRRAQLIKKSGADVFVSVHLNAIPSPRWSGAQTFYYPTLEANQRLATFIQKELVRNLNNTKRQARYSGGVYILKTSQIPSALVEVGFLSNPQEAAMLARPDYQKKLAAAIYTGILRFYSGEALPKEAP